MKINRENFVCFICLFISICSISALKAQTPLAPVEVEGDEYAFYYDAMPNYGLYFSLADSRYEFRNSAANPMFWVDANTGQGFLQGNLSFGPTASLMIDNNRYAFRSKSFPDYGLFFSLADVEYQFKTLGGTNVFAIGANTGNVWNAGDLTVGGIALIGNATVCSSDYKLFVEKGILTEKVQVALKSSLDWCDHVFNENYPLKPLADVEKFIDKNKRLPQMPSADELVENGIDIAKMDANLLRQIEELWLHLIALNKENEKLKKEVDALKSSSK